MNRVIALHTVEFPLEAKRAESKELRKRNAELERANEILKVALRRRSGRRAPQLDRLGPDPLGSVSRLISG